MVRKRIKITARGPISITGRKPYGQFYETLNYVPARTLRGAFARSLLDKCRLAESDLTTEPGCAGCSPDTMNECDFHNIMGKGEQIRFGDCYAVRSEPVGDIHTVVPHVLPATAVSCKYHPGFSTGYRYYLDLELPVVKDEGPHGVFDLLIKHIVYDELEDADYVFNPKCLAPECDGIVEPSVGPYQLFADIEERAYASHKAKIHRFGRSAMNRKTWSTQEGMLYSIQALARGNVFLGEIEVDENADGITVDRAIDLLTSLNNIGGQSSRGLGSVEVEIKDHKPDALSVENRINEFNKVIDNVRGTPVDRIYFTIDLQSDAILRGLLDEPTLQMDENLLRSYLALADGEFSSEQFDRCEVRLERAYSSGLSVGGWSMAWDLPKYVRLATAKGSVFLFSASNIDSSLCRSLAALEQRGVGESLEEGYGKINICEQFHLEVEPI